MTETGVTTLQTAPTPPQNLDAEESVLGAMLIAPAGSSVIDRITETGLRPADFYRESHGRIYAAALTLHRDGHPVDALTVANHLQELAQLDQAGGTERIHELGALVPAIGNAPHHARLVVDAARIRQIIRTGAELASLGYRADQPVETLEHRAQELLEQIGDRNQHRDLRPLWLNQALTEEIPDTAEYVEGVLEAGVLADIVGLPYLHKSAAALELAVKVAKGRGLFLGKYPIRQQAKVAYFWADDSRPQELKRIQSYAAANALADDGRDLPVAFYLNPGISIPDDLPAIKRQIREHGYRLLVFDSLYNFADFDFVKDTGAVKHLYTALKRLCDDIEGLTVVLVDHASKPSDSNRDRDDSISSYGAVWKAAAVRCSIVVTKKGQSLFVSATGNNVKGFPRTPAYFNQERLELALAEESVPDPEREQRIDDDVLDYITRMPGKSSRQIRESVKGRNADITAALARLAAANLICDTYGSGSQLFGNHPEPLSTTDPESGSHNAGNRKAKTAWIPLNHAEKAVPGTAGNTPEPPVPAHGSFPTESGSQTGSLYVVEGPGTPPEGEHEGQTPEHDHAPIDETLAPDDDWLA